MTEYLNQLVLSQRKKFPVNEDDLQWHIKKLPDDHRVKVHRGAYEASVRHPTYPYKGWAINKDEDAARAKALERFIYARDYGL